MLPDNFQAAQQRRFRRGKAQILTLIEQHPDTLDGDGLGIADGHGLRIDLIAHGSHAGE